LTAARARLRRAAADILHAALRAAAPGALVRKHLRRRGDTLEAGGLAHRLGRGRVVLVAAGKAAGAMAAAAEPVLGRALDAGLAIGVAEAPLGRVRSLAAGHPIPDPRGLAAAAEVEALVRGLGERDLLVVLLSGGASALLPAPADGITLADKAAATRVLLRSGATIGELNAVRKHLSRLKGGGLARLAAPARVVTLALSDVVGDDPAVIASGPTAPDPSTFAEALAVVRRRDPDGRVPQAVVAHLEAGARGERRETPKPGDPAFRQARFRVIGSNRLALEAAARAARTAGFRPLVLTTRLEGEAREAARVLTAVLRECVEADRPARPPVCLLAGGETTVEVRGDGQGGRNQEMAAAAARPLAAFGSPALLASLATDGVDGASDAAGGVVDDGTLAQGEALGLPSPEAFLARNDSRHFLGPLGGLIVTGPTGTNVIDVTVLLAGAAGRRGGRRL
jgi:hydroxypyruvate reductase